MRPSFRFSLLALALLAAPQCRVLFWSDRQQWLPANWMDESRVLEARLTYEAKLSWYPLNQNELSRGFETRIYLHEVEGERVVASRELAHYEGWTLAGSLRAAGDRFVVIRSVAGDGDASEDLRELAIFPCCNPGRPLTTPSQILPAEARLLAAIPSPDGLRVVLMETTAPEDAPQGGDLRLRFFSYQDGAFRPQSRAEVYYPGAPGLPEYVWAADASGFYIRDARNSVKLVGIDGTIAAAQTFPACFRPAGDASPRGAAWLRSYEPEQAALAETLADGVTIQAAAGRAPAPAMINDATRIGEGCP